MAKLFNLYIQSPNPDYSFILSPFSLHPFITSTSPALHQSSHRVTLILTDVSLTLFTQSPDCTFNKDISKRLIYTSRKFPPSYFDDGVVPHSNIPSSSLEHFQLHHSKINTDITGTSAPPLHVSIPPILNSIKSPVLIISYESSVVSHLTSSNLIKETMNALGWVWRLLECWSECLSGRLRGSLLWWWCPIMICGGGGFLSPWTVGLLIVGWLVVGVVLVSCGCIWSVCARRNDAGTMISAVLS